MGVDLRACRAALVRLADDDMILDTAIDELAERRAEVARLRAVAAAARRQVAHYADDCPKCGSPVDSRITGIARDLVLNQCMSPRCRWRETFLASWSGEENPHSG